MEARHAHEQDPSIRTGDCPGNLPAAARRLFKRSRPGGGYHHGWHGARVSVLAGLALAAGYYHLWQLLAGWQRRDRPGKRQHGDGGLQQRHGPTDPDPERCDHRYGHGFPSAPPYDQRCGQRREDQPGARQRQSVSGRSAVQVRPQRRRLQAVYHRARVY